MTRKWQNRLLYWAMAIIPLSGLWLIGRIYGPFWLTGFLLLYIFIYRPALDTQRLISLGALEEKDAWRFYIPFAVDPRPYLRKLWLA
jgi:hypothetical protein